MILLALRPFFCFSTVKDGEWNVKCAGRNKYCNLDGNPIY
ncbi:hypothetical protein ROSINTL182_06539 [Roseburia intestinalis L1-82]|uniref:Uncharacterized protein n=1 Tax=Roseburia intestinalis L1-82 TaxID=536231 RepID=C7G9G0_9FIRM|nr:hypothetical protein ROSINTL182_06539 [Roseburia intestinalis L1-82]